MPCLCFSALCFYSTLDQRGAEKEVALEEKHHPPAAKLGHTQSRPVLSQETTPDSHSNLIQLEGVIPTTQIKDPPGKTTQVIQELVATLTRTLVEPTLEVILIRTLPFHLEEDIPIRTLVEPTLEAIPIKTLPSHQQEDTNQLEDILINNTQEEETIQIRIQDIQLEGNTQVQEVIPTKILAEVGILTSIQEQVAIRTSILVLEVSQQAVAMEAATLSEVEIQDRVGVEIQEATREAIQGATQVEL